MGHPRRGPGSRRRVILTVVLIGIGLGLAIAEIALRVVEATWQSAAPTGVVDSPKALRSRTSAGKRITPNLDVVVRRHPTSGRDVRVRTNSLGLRGAEIPARSDGELRVLVLGDSITFADYVDEDETFPARLEARLRAAQPGRTVRVLNGGGSNLGTQGEAALLAEWASTIRPDVVLVGFYLDDSTSEVGYPEVVRLPDWLRWSRLARRIVVDVANYRHRARLGPRYDWVPAFSERRWIADRAAYEQLVRLAAHDWGAAWRDDSWGPVEDGFRRMLRLGEQYGFRVVAAVFPVRVQVESRVADDRPQQRFRQLADRLGIPALDLLPVLTSANAPSFYDHCHLTPNGNAAVAGALADFLASRTAPSGVR